MLSRRLPSVVCGLLCAVWICCSAPSAHAQSSSSSDEAQLLISGKILDAFISLHASDRVLVQVLVQSSAALRFDELGRRTFPAPGESLFVEVADVGANILNGHDRSGLPQPGSLVRARLIAGDRGQWTAASPAEFVVVSADDSELAGPASATESAAERLGLTVRTRTLETGRALEVTAVRGNSAAQAAGIEVGDTLVKANRVDLTDPQRLDAALNDSHDQLTIVVRDVRTGREVSVDVPLNLMAKVPVGGARRLGVTGEVAFYQGEPALKITAVEDNSPAAQAGIRAGWLLVQANGKPLADSSALVQAEREAQGQLVLKIFDPGNRRESTVRVDLR